MPSISSPSGPRYSFHFRCLQGGQLQGGMLSMAQRQAQAFAVAQGMQVKVAGRGKVSGQMPPVDK